MDSDNGKILKQKIRKKYKKLREQMLADQVKTASAKVCERILNADLYQNARCIYAYYPLGNEVDIRAVAEDALRSGKRVAFPKVFGETMRFFEVKGLEQLAPGTFGVMEPEEDLPADWETPLVLTPGVAFDRDGNRMGYGKGYYDRYFAERSGAVMIGVAYELQIAERIPVGLYDRGLDGIVTENEGPSLIFHGKGRILDR